MTSIFLILLTEAVAAEFSVPGRLPDIADYPQLNFFAGLISLVIVVGSAIAYLRGMRIGSQAKQAPPAIDLTRPDPSNAIYWDAILTNIFESLKRIESMTSNAVAADAALREHIITSSSSTRHGIIEKLQEIVNSTETQELATRQQQEAHRAALRSQLGEILNTLSRLEGRIIGRSR